LARERRRTGCWRRMGQRAWGKKSSHDWEKLVGGERRSLLDGWGRWAGVLLELGKEGRRRQGRGRGGRRRQKAG